MKNHAPGRRRAAASAAVLVGLALALATTSPASADPIGAGRASAFGGTITVGGEEVVPPTPQVEVTTVPSEAEDTTIDIPAEPLAVSGTLNAFAALHATSDIPSRLESTGVAQDPAGPFNALAEGLVEGADVLLDSVAEDVSLVSADLIRGEAAAVCTGDTVAYTANSEIINLQIGGEEVPLNDPIQQILDGLNDALEQSGLNAVVNIERNVVTPIDGGGIAVDALVVTVLSAAGEDPLGQVRLGHAEVSGVACGELPECSDGIDNDGDGTIDFEAPEGATADPHCTSAEDDTEASQCTDGVDNDDPEDTLADAADPGCPGTLEERQLDDDETDPLAGAPAVATDELPRTGSDDASTVALAGAMGAAALGTLALRRRLG